MAEIAVATRTEAGWSLGHRVAFRFATIYIVLFFFPFPLGYVPFTEWIGESWQSLTEPAVAVLGKVVGREPVFEMTGSGDTTAAWLTILLDLLVSASGAAVWSVLARRKTSHVLGAAWLRVYTRYGLAAIMCSYGFAKVFPSQFTVPSPDVLLQRFGDASPMRLMWTFMGFSPGYTMFAGAAEVLGGALLFSRRTTTIGALIIAAVMTNVFVMNLAYDIPVKQYSLHLVLLALFLLAPDLRRLLRVFVLNQAVPPASIDLPSLPLERRRRITFHVARVLLVGMIFFGNAWGGWTSYRDYVLAPLPPLYGAWSVETLVTDPPLTDETRWRWLSFNRWRGITIRQVNEAKSVRYAVKIDETAKTIVFTRRAGDGDPKLEHTLTYEQADPDHFVLKGKLEGIQVDAKLLRRADDWPLLNRGFHWVSEQPYNR